jgi:hypothetical protein
MKIGQTDRGFAYAEFEDIYGIKCSIQESSLATEYALWLGVDDPSPKIMASQAAEYGIATTKDVGWIPYPIPMAVSLVTRMHLSQERAKELIAVLQRFVETGGIAE